MKKFIAVAAAILACACSDKQKDLPSEDQMTAHATQMLGDAQIAATELKVDEYSWDRVSTEDVRTARVHFKYKGQQFVCLAVAYRTHTTMGNCKTGSISTNAQFNFDKKSGTTSYQKATAKSDDNATQNNGTPRYDLDGASI